MNKKTPFFYILALIYWQENFHPIKQGWSRTKEKKNETTYISKSKFVLEFYELQKQNRMFCIFLQSKHQISWAEQNSLDGWGGGGVPLL